jgi:hypothetical protein
LGPEIQAQVHASAVRVHVTAGARFLRGRRAHVKTGGVTHAIEVVSPQIASDLQAGVGAWDVEEACAIKATNLDVLDRRGFDRNVSSLRPGYHHQSRDTQQ